MNCQGTSCRQCRLPCCTPEACGIKPATAATLITTNSDGTSPQTPHVPDDTPADWALGWAGYLALIALAIAIVITLALLSGVLARHFGLV